MGRTMSHEERMNHEVVEQAVNEYKQCARELLQALEEEFWLIIDETKDPAAHKKACEIRRVIEEGLDL